MRVALIQLVSGHDVAANLETITSTARAAAGDGARLLVYPEAAMFAFGAPLGGIAEPLDGPFASAVQGLARELGVTIVVGMFTPADAGRVFNTLLVAGGDRPVGYDKIHLFDAFGFKESDTVAPGGERVVVEVDGVAGRGHHLLRRALPRPVRRARRRRSAGVRGLGVVGRRPRQGRAVGAARPGAGARQHERRARVRAGRPRDARPTGRQRPHGRRPQPGRLTVRRGAGAARGRPGNPRGRPGPLRGRPARTTLPVLANRRPIG